MTSLPQTPERESAVCALEEFMEQHYCPDFAEHVRPAVYGDAEEAEKLVFSTGDHRRGTLAAMVWNTNPSREVWRVILGGTWDHGHESLIATVRNRNTLRKMFRFARFPIPDHLPETMTIWRGTFLCPVERAAKGFSWTTERDVACFFAMRYEDRAKFFYPLVLQAQIGKGDIVRIPDESGHGSDGKASTVPTRIRPPFRFDSGHHSGAIRPV